MRSDWRKATLGDCVMMNDDTYSPREAWSFVNYLDTSSITENRVAKIQHLVVDKDKIPSRARRKVQPGDIVYSTVRPNQRHFGLIKEPPENLLVSTGFATIRGKEGLALTEYVYWFLVQDYIVEHLHAIAEQSTSAYPSIKPNDIARLELDLPPLAEQRRIAHILGTLDDKIELNRRMNATLEGMAQALFKSWFVNFEPVRAKIEGRWRRGESLPGLPAELYNLFPDRLVPSELGEVPEGWEVKNIGDIATIVGGTTPSTRKPEYWDGGIHHWATPKDLSSLDSPVLSETARKITDAGLDRITSGLLPIGSVLLSSRAPIGYLAINEIPVSINQGFIGILPNKGISNLFMLYWCMFSHTDIINHANGSTFLEINKRNFRQLRTVVPDLETLGEFDRLAQEYYRNIALNEKHSRTLAELRDSLLPGLVSGEVGV